MCDELVVFCIARYDLAALLNMNLQIPLQAQIFAKILKDIPCDDDWDETMPLEKSYKSLNMKRYKLSKTLLSEKTKVEGTEEELSASTSKDHKGSGLPMITGKPDIVIKKCPEVIAMQEEARIVSAGEVKLQSKMRELKKMKAQLLALDTVAGQL